MLIHNLSLIPSSRAVELKFITQTLCAILGEFASIYHAHRRHHHTRIYSVPITIICHRCITESSELSANTECQTKKCAASHFLKSLGSVTALKSFDSEFHADRPAYVKACSPKI